MIRRYIILLFYFDIYTYSIEFIRFFYRDLSIKLF